MPIFDVQTNREVILDFDTNDRSIDFSDVRFVKTKDQLFLTSKSHLRLARSIDGIHFLIDDKPFLSSQFFYEEYGIEDPRITFVDDWYYIDYSATSRHGVFTCLARTKDFVSVEKLGIIFLPDNKDVSIFPQKINGKYYALNRPVSAYFQRPEMWISTSADLRSFSEHHLLCEPRPDKFDSTRIGAGCVPVLTSKGWLEIYHGCDKNDKYCMGALLLDANDPTKIIARRNALRVKRIYAECCIWMRAFARGRRIEAVLRRMRRKHLLGVIQLRGNSAFAYLYQQYIKQNSSNAGCQLALFWVTYYRRDLNNGNSDSCIV